MKQTRKLIVMLLSFAMLFSSVPAFSKGSSSSSGRSSSSSSSRSSGGGFSSSSKPSGGGFSSSSRPSATAPSKPSAPSNGGFSSSSKPGVTQPSKPNTVTPTPGFSSSSKPGSVAPATSPSSSVANRVNNASALAPAKSKEAFTAEFKQQNAAKYQTKFTTQPAARPSYIPQTTVVGGASYPIVFNPTLGTYGYYGGFADTFVAYDPFPVLAASAYSSYANSHRPVVVHSSTSGWTILISFLLIAGIGIFVIYVLNKRAGY